MYRSCRLCALTGSWRYHSPAFLSAPNDCGTNRLQCSPQSARLRAHETVEVRLLGSWSAQPKGKLASIEAFKIRNESLMTISNSTVAQCPCEMQGSMGTGAYIEAARQQVQSAGLKIALEVLVLLPGIRDNCSATARRCRRVVGAAALTRGPAFTKAVATEQ